jgi:hypothetical protein
VPISLPTRIPTLYYGPQRQPRQQTAAEKRADRIYGVLVIASEFFFLLFAFVGYIRYDLYGLLLAGAAGYLAGILLRRSLGMRGRKANTGFFKRMRERGKGSRPGLLEGWLERMSGNELTPARCASVAQVYEKAVQRLRQASTLEEQNRILADLDQRVYKLLAGSPRSRL